MKPIRHGLAAVLLAAAALAGITQPAAEAAAAPVTVTVNARAGLATMPATGLGVNDAIWDAELGTAAEAAGWVRYANVTKGYGVKYWTVGNENYGNGHAARSGRPTTTRTRARGRTPPRSSSSPAR